MNKQLGKDPKEMYYPIPTLGRWSFAFDRWLCSPAYFTVELISGR